MLMIKIELSLTFIGLFLGNTQGEIPFFVNKGFTLQGVHKGFPLLNHVVKKINHISHDLCHNNPYLMRANNGKSKSLLYNSDCAIDLPVLLFLLRQITAIKVATKLYYQSY